MEDVKSLGNKGAIINVSDGYARNSLFPNKLAIVATDSTIKHENERQKIEKIKETFWSDVKIPGDIDEMNVELEKANRVADFIELGEMMAMDALNREESCGGHFREEFQTPEGEALRQDDKFAFVAAWECKGNGNKPELHKEDLKFEALELKQRNYKL